MWPISSLPNAFKAKNQRPTIILTFLLYNFDCYEIFDQPVLSYSTHGSQKLVRTKKIAKK